VAKQGRTVIFVSHNLQNIQKICNKGIFLKNGNIFSKGEMMHVSDNYLSESRQIVKNSHFKRNEVVEKIAWIEEATIDVNDNQVSYINCGDSIDFRIKYISKQKDLKASFFIGIFSAYGEKLLHFGTSFSENEVFKTKIEGCIFCKIPKFPLSAGQYFVNLSLNINDLPIDRIENAFVLTVKEGDFFNIGKAINYDGTKFLVNHFWQIK
jgi:lipopolysaccharide transport system ATP-binding protein